MNTLNFVIDTLLVEKLVVSARDFSQKYCGKNPNWASNQRHKRRDFSLEAALTCISSIELMINCRDKLGLTETTEYMALYRAHSYVKIYLIRKHRIVINDEMKSVLFISR